MRIIHKNCTLVRTHMTVTQIVSNDRVECNAAIYYQISMCNREWLSKQMQAHQATTSYRHRTHTTGTTPYKHQTMFVCLKIQHSHT